ncbi:MAG: M20/M25/M40 family metallo-hydrolase, partial [Eubacteriales bacterium]
ILFVSPGKNILITDSRYEEEYKKSAIKCSVRITKAKNIGQIILEVCAETNSRSIGFEADHFTYQGYLGLKRLLGNKICCPALDDRAGVASILRCLEILKDKKHNCKLSVLFSVQEETGGCGAHVGGFSASADESIAVDVSFAMAPDMQREKCADIGKGPMLGISPTLDYEMGRTLEKIAKAKSIPYQLEIMGGRTGTNADEIQISGRGTKMALLSIPLKNMHTSIEILDLEDVENLARMMAEYILERSEVNA